MNQYINIIYSSITLDYLHVVLPLKEILLSLTKKRGDDRGRDSATRPLLDGWLEPVLVSNVGHCV